MLGITNPTTFIGVDIHMLIILTKPIKKKIGEIFPCMKEAFRNKRQTYHAKYITTDDHKLRIYQLSQVNLTYLNKGLLVLRIEK